MREGEGEKDGGLGTEKTGFKGNLTCWMRYVAFCGLGPGQGIAYYSIYMYLLCIGVHVIDTAQY